MVHYINGIMFNGSSDQEVATTQLIDKTFACQGVGNKYDKNSGAFYLSKISRGLVMLGIS